MLPNYGPDYSSESEDSLLDDDLNYAESLKKAKSSILKPPIELTEADKEAEKLKQFYNAFSASGTAALQEILSQGINVNADLCNGWRGIMLAASFGNPEATQLLIEAGADIHYSKVADFVTPLMMACSCSEYTTPYERSFATVKLLVENGANVQKICRKRMDALMYASYNGNLAAVEYLLPMANKSAVDNQGWSALTWAVSNNQVHIVQFLWENGFSETLTDVRGNTPLDIARDNGFDNISELFPKKGTDMIMEILSKSRFSYGDAFMELKNGEKPGFFEDVATFLLSVNCGHLIPLFFEKDLTLAEFLAMDEEDLRKVGVLLPYQRNRILTGLHRFHKHPYHPKSIHICLKNDTFSNVDVATELVSAIKQVIAMEASLKYLLKHLEDEELSEDHRAQVIKNLTNIKLKTKRIKLVTRKLEKKVILWDVSTTPPDLITENSIRSRFPWRKLTLCLGMFSVIVICKMKHILSR